MLSLVRLAKAVTIVTLQPSKTQLIERLVRRKVLGSYEQIAKKRIFWIVLGLLGDRGQQHLLKIMRLLLPWICWQKSRVLSAFGGKSGSMKSLAGSNACTRAGNRILSHLRSTVSQSTTSSCSPIQLLTAAHTIPGNCAVHKRTKQDGAVLRR